MNENGESIMFFVDLGNVVLLYNILNAENIFFIGAEGVEAVLYKISVILTWTELSYCSTTPWILPNRGFQPLGLICTLELGPHECSNGPSSILQE